MKKIKSIHFGYIVIFLLMLTVKNAYSQDPESSKDMCFQCHMIIDDKSNIPAKLYQNDIHFRKGITCAACHGGDATNDDMEESMSKEKGFIGVPTGLQAARICAKCHGNQFNMLVNSVHGSTKGKGMIINSCITCHGIHNITSVKSPGSKVSGKNLVALCSGCHSNASYMKNFNPGIAVDQHEKYKTSVHGKKVFQGDNKAANCASCHGSHDVMKVNNPKSKVYFSNIPETCGKCHSNEQYMKSYGIPTSQYSDYKSSVHGIALFLKGDRNAPNCNTCHGNHGAAPPEVESITKVCGMCHSLTEQMFNESPHKEAFAKEKIHDCVACHNNHKIDHPTVEMIGGEKSVCKNCHQDNDKGIQAAMIMKNMLDSLVNDVELANYFLNRAEQLGMDVSDVKFDSADIRTILTVSRNTVHYSDIEKFMEAIKDGFLITEAAKTVGEESISEYYFRRMGFGVATFFITLIMVTLFLKLRILEKEKK
jgi:hypothetical protein